MSTIATCLIIFSLAASPAPNPTNYFRITVIDADTGRGVPLVELKTVNNIRHYTDSNGIIAFHEPGLMDQRVFFIVKSHGYEYPKDGFGYSGLALDVTEGGSAKLEIKRINIAERLYRITGGGIYRDSILTGQPVPIRQPVLNGQVTGQDSIQSAIYQGKLWWFWGDTGKTSYPLGNFHMSGAIVRRPDDGGLDPIVGVDLDYFVDENGFSKKMAPHPGLGPVWLDSFVTLIDEDGHEKMFAAYARVTKAMVAVERGLMRFNDEKRIFEIVAKFDLNAPVRPNGHPFKLTHDDLEYIYFPKPFPFVRTPADPKCMADLDRYEAFTCLAKGSTLKSPRIDRTEDGSVRYSWKTNTPPIGPKDQARFVNDGLLKPDEAIVHLQDVDTAAPVLPHNGSVSWNPYRGRWITIRCQSMGTSMLGETWYAEADTPLGPWVYARKIVTHDTYTFYNPKQHPEFDQNGGRTIFFEGTYASTFSGNPDQTPRYDYNQIMYKLDLTEPRLVLPVPVYQLSDNQDAFATLADLPSRMRPRPVAFFAPDRPGPGTVPVYVTTSDNGSTILKAASAQAPNDENENKPICHAIPADTTDRPKTVVPLYEFTNDDTGHRAYGIEKNWSKTGYRLAEKPLCLVWPNPMRLMFPLD